MRVHTAAVDTSNRFCHKDGMETVLEGDRLGCELEGNYPVRGDEGITIFEVDLVLAVSDFVVRCFNLKSHLPQGKDNIPSDILCRVCRSEIEICAMVFKLRRRYAVIHFKQEKFKFGSGVKRESHLCGFSNGLSQNITGITLKRLIAVRLDITDKPGNLSFLGSPGKDHVCCRVRLKHHVRLFDTGKSFDR